MKNLTILFILSIPLQLLAQTTGKLTDKRDGRVYQTVRIDNHWWMAENLNYGTRINGGTNQTSNGIVEKYCYDNLESNCNTRGALYQWNEMMNYTTFPVNQGICPVGWHVPSDDEWKELEIYLGMSEADANLTGFRGTDQGTQLKAGGSSGFNANLDGYMTTADNFIREGEGNCFWTATDIFARYLLDSRTEVYRWSTPSKSYGLSLRCKQNTVVLTEQPVSYIPSSKTSLHYSWADLDKDNDLDLLVTSNELGKYGNALMNQMFTKIYKNNGSGVFSKTSLIADSVSMGSSSVGDYDNDGDLDIIVSGASEIYVIVGPGITVGIPYTRIYQNNITSFDPIETNIANLCRSALEFQDLDNDGDLDLIICGDQKFTSFVYNPLTAVYRNNGNDNFEEVNLDFKNIANGRISCFDYDKNGFSDILITGLDQNNEVFTAIYKNKGEFGFDEILLSLDSIRVNYNGWLDFNRDGRFDIISGGALFKNNGGDVFTIIDTLVHCSGFGDFNNDGLQDIINNNEIYLNERGEYFFTDDYSLQDEIYSCADINKDYNMDIIGKSFHYINNESRKNTRPSIPGNLRAYVREGKAVFKWNRSTDSETSQNNITFNVSIKDKYNRIFFSPGSDLSTGYRRMMKFGNAGTNDSIVVEGIEGTLFWQVQAVDNNMLASQFSKVDTFVFPAVFNNVHSESNYLNYRWGDYNMDGKFDYVSRHYILFQNHHLFENKGDLDFIEDTILVLPLNSDCWWGDYDNDNDIDLIGIDSNFVVLNNEGNNFITIDNPFPVQQWRKLLVIKDLDNDGDNDFIISSDTDTRIYFRDSGDLFSSLLLENAACDSVICFDYDNDSDNDIFIKDTKTRFENYAYRRFEKQSLAVVPYGLTYDFDNDEDIDVLDNNILYVNDNHNFIIENTSIRKLTESFRQIVGDIDNDGDFDIVLAGRFVNSAYLGLYLNDGNGKFTEDNDYSGLQTLAISYSTSLSNFVDFDNDNDLDFVYTYRDPDIGWQNSHFDRNNFNRNNASPGVPENLKSLKKSHGIELSWIPPVDQESGTNLTYNLRIGTSPGGMEIMSPLSDIGSGNLYIPETGKIMQPYWNIDTMSLDTYYWSVQAVDHGYQGGQWADEQMFTISNVFADFDADTVCMGTFTSFADRSVIFSGLIGSWYWDFGDGTFSTNRNPEHLFSNGGVHNVKLKVTAGQDVDSIIKPVHVKHRPLANFTASTVCEGTKTTFTNLSGIDSITVTDWIWHFGDGDVSDFQGDIQHPYLNPGSYNTQLKISATNGCSDSLNKEVIVGSVPNSKIGLDYGFPELCEGDSTRLSVEYHANYHYQWQTGGINLTKDTLDYLVIKGKGNYSVDVTNRSGNCLASSDVVNIVMLESPPSMTITASTDTNICQGEKVYLEVPYDPVYSYLWKYNGLILSNATSNSYDAEKEGSYTVDVSFGTCKTTSHSKQIVYKPGLPQPKLLTFGSTAWYFVCDIENARIYRWYYNGNLVAETRNNAYWAGDRMGEYYVEVNDGGECFVPSGKITIPVISTDISHFNAEHQLYLYPNPASGTIRVFNKDQYTGKVVVRIGNTEGRIIKELELYKNKVDFSEEINLSELKAGLYILEFQTNQNTLKERFVLMK